MTWNPEHKDEIDRLTRQVRGLPDEWLACRDMRHAWVVENDYHVISRTPNRPSLMVVGRVLVCMRCDTRRHEKYMPSTWYGLEKTSTRYEYPRGYQLHGVVPEVSPQSIVQREQYTRALHKITAKQNQTTQVTQS